MNDYFKNIIQTSTGANSVSEIEMIQSLWSGYGKILRFALKGADIETVVVKHVRLPKQEKHPRGWNTNLSHERKLKSYKVETAWYKNWSLQCDLDSRIPKCYALETQGNEVLMVLEDLNESGFPARRSSVSDKELVKCLEWLANFHATFMGKNPDGLWEIGTYWHLDTRPEELEVLQDKMLKNAASKIDEVLNNSKFKTFVHGDAKLANFCFSNDGENVAAVDFQYVGGGCGMKDVAYFVGSCLYEDECESMEEEILDVYFTALKRALIKKKSQYNPDEVEASWRSLYHVAWTDFHRFLKGWSPGHWKINSYSERLVREVVSNL